MFSISECDTMIKQKKWSLGERVGRRFTSIVIGWQVWPQNN